jgi:hypothetical protein
MYAAYLYILRAFDCAADSRRATSRDPEREIADGRRPSAAVSRDSTPVDRAQFRRTIMISGQGSEGEARAGMADPDRRLV